MSGVNTLLPETSRLISLRLFYLVLVLFAELIIYGILFDAYLPELLASDRWFAFLAYSGQLTELLVILLTTLGFVIWVRLHRTWDKFSVALEGYRIRYFVLLHFIAFLGLFFSGALVFGQTFEVEAIPNSAVLAWLVSAALFFFFWVLCIGPPGFWKAFVIQEYRFLLLALLAGVLAWMVAQLSQSLWEGLSYLTFYASAGLLDLFYPEIFVDSQVRLLGIDDFIVHIGQPCSGYEGIGLVVVFTTFYLLIFRQEFRFPQALLLFPIGILTIWVFNLFRIVALISIGEGFSPAIAVGGFHSKAGWISFLLVTFGLLILAHKSPWIAAQPKLDTCVDHSQGERNAAVASLLPFIVLLSSILVTSAFSADFVWLYPLRVIAVALSLFLCWKVYEFKYIQFRLEPLLVGVLVFIVWVSVIPNYQDNSLEFANAIGNAPQGLVLLWMFFRVVGAVITVPLAEELFFRGYLLSRLNRTEVRLDRHIEFSWTALLISSVLFGLLHDAFIMGVLAGLAYALVRYRSDSFLDAFLAHSITNLLLSIYVILTGYWSYW